MMHIPYAPGTLVKVEPCYIHSGGIGRIMRAYLLLAPGDRWSEAMQVYDIEIANDVLAYVHHELEAI